MAIPSFSAAVEIWRAMSGSLKKIAVTRFPPPTCSESIRRTWASDASGGKTSETAWIPAWSNALAIPRNLPSASDATLETIGTNTLRCPRPASCRGASRDASTPSCVTWLLRPGSPLLTTGMPRSINPLMISAASAGTVCSRSRTKSAPSHGVSRRSTSSGQDLAISLQRANTGAQ